MISSVFLPKRTCAHLELKGTKNIRPETLNCRSKNVTSFYFFQNLSHAILEFQRNLRQDLIIIGVLIVTIEKNNNKKVKQESLQIHFADGVPSSEGD